MYQKTLYEFLNLITDCLNIYDKIIEDNGQEGEYELVEYYELEKYNLQNFIKEIRDNDYNLNMDINTYFFMMNNKNYDAYKYKDNINKAIETVRQFNEIEIEKIININEFISLFYIEEEE